AGVSLPVLAHLLSRRKYDTVNWGAMQFLEIGRNARRRIRLEELLLLLLRMAMIAMIAIALSRPWMAGGIVNSFASKPACDVALVIDSSYSTDWRAKARTPHEEAVSWAKQLLDRLGPGETVGLVDARGTVEAKVPTLTRDRNLIRELLDTLPKPSGSSRLNDGILRGLQMVNAGTNISRHVVVVTDGQFHPWRDADEHLWLQLKELREQATVPADIWVVSTQKQQTRQSNDALDRLLLSRELTVVDFPMRIRTRLKNSGARAAANQKVYLQEDGQRLADKTLSVRIEPDGQATVEFEHRFRTPGSHVVAVSIDEDSLPGDDRSEAAVDITAALPVLLVDGSSSPDPAQSEMFFARSALSAVANPTPWVAARSVSSRSFSGTNIGDAQVILLANIPRLTDEQLDTLKEFVDGGGGLGIALGDQIEQPWYNDRMYDQGAGLLPAWLEAVQSPPPGEDEKPVTVLSESLQLPWISRFQTGGDDGFLDARFSRWYSITLQPELPDEQDGVKGTNVGAANAITGKQAVSDRAPSTIEASYSNGDAFLISRQSGRGRAALMTTTLDADWTTLPARPDYVAFLHEWIFQLASGRVNRNVDTGTPLLYPIAQSEKSSDWIFISPGGNELEAIAAGDELRPLVRLDDTHQPGVYTLRKRQLDGSSTSSAKDEHFVVNFDRSESDLMPLSTEGWAELTDRNRLHQIETPEELFESLKTESSRVELWHLLLLAFLAILVGEVIMTRRLVQGGHVFVDEGVSSE
ncbi:MAG: VWA domain-containing protein, partial [Planctomycetota bacterium]|nr:VWA domain-containing protein [Planctomycetota bacterium]